MSLFTDDEPTPADVAAAARAAHAAGLSVVRVREDGTKAPDGPWKRYQRERASAEQLSEWFRAGATGLGVVCGAVSGNLEMLEFEGRAVAAGFLGAFEAECDRAGLGEVWARVRAGYSERTPSNGLHVYLRCPVIDGNTRLASDANGDVLIETRGEGGYVVVAPSYGAVHLTGKPYVLERGGFDTIATITEEERAGLFAVARSFNRTTPVERLAVLATSTTDGTSPLDRFDAEHTCDEVLLAHGFQRHHEDRQGRHYTRPGKDRRAGSSATVWADDGRCTLFSTSIEVPAEFIGHTRLQPYRLEGALRYGGDFAAMARDLTADDRRKVAEYVGGLPLRTVAPALATEAKTEAPALEYRRVPGDVFVLDAPEAVPAVWGRGAEVLWASGEPLLLCGPPGVGKTTVANQLVRARLGLAPEVLGFPVVPGHRVLYLAADRPRQIARAMRRLFSDEHRAHLHDALVVVQGPPPQDLAKHPETLVEMVTAEGADTVVLDSLKDMAIGLSDDDVGAGLNRAVQAVIAADVEVLALHHQRKAQQGGPAPKALADVYGSAGVTAGAGSVLLLWAEAGATEVELRHLKQPADVVGPLTIEHDHRAGTSAVVAGFDLLRYLGVRGDKGATAADAAQAQHRRPATPGETKAMTRRLESLADAGLAEVEPGGRGGSGGSRPARYRALKVVTEVVDK